MKAYCASSPIRSQDTLASEADITLFSEGLESRGEADISRRFTQVNACLQVSALKGKSAPVRAYKSETEFWEWCMEGHTSRSCERGQRRTRERTRCADETAGAKALWWGENSIQGDEGSSHSTCGQERGAQWCTEISGGRLHRALLMLCPKGNGKYCLLHEGISVSNPQKVEPKPRVSRTSPVDWDPGSDDVWGSWIALLLGVLGFCNTQNLYQMVPGFGEARHL